jgi:UDP-N-acetylmuramyl pentapeptide phosphotransferase/UDP-N-acetylglucosamine-1-phosphate transferase
MDEIGGDPGASPFSGSLFARLDGLDRIIATQRLKANLLGRLLTQTQLNARGLLLCLLALLLLLVLPSLLERLLRRYGWVRPNFRQEIIPQSFGLYILLFVVCMGGALVFLLPSAWNQYGSWLLLAVGYGVLGGIDDRWGSAKYRGLKGHFRAAFQEKTITTGFLKAILGLAFAFCLAWQLASNSPLRLLLATLLIALGANVMNLFDLRPGRACAVFLVASLPLLVCFWQWDGWRGGIPPLLLVVLPVWRVWEKDARAKVMLGDAGSNLLGAALGFACAQPQFSLGVQGGVVALFIAIHLLAEKVSFTQEIERRPLLRFLDRLTGVR